MKEEMVDTTYGDVFIKVSISFIRIPSLFSYDNLSIFDNKSSKNLKSNLFVLIYIFLIQFQNIKWKLQ